MIGERLLELRKDADLTQDELAAILKINKHSISSYERGKSEPPDEIKIAIAKYFNVSVDYLLGITNEPIPIDRQDKVIRLPSGLSPQAVVEAKQFIDFLANKNK